MSHVPPKNQLTPAKANEYTKRIAGILEQDERNRDAEWDRQRQQRRREMKARVDEIRVMRESLTYRPDRPESFFRDVADIKMNPGRQAAARERLERNNKEAGTAMKAAGLTQTATAGGEFVPPLWVVEDLGDQLRAGRPFLNALGTRALPPRVSQLDIPALTTGASAAVQTDGSSVSNTDWVTTSAIAQVQTVAGRTVASYQVVELGGPNADAAITRDLYNAVNSAFDAAVLTGNVTNAKGILNVTGVNSVTYTDASPTAPEFSTPIGQAASAIGKNGALPSFAVTSPSIGFFIQAGSDAAGRPLYLSTGPDGGRRMVGTNPASDELPFLPGETDGIFGNVAGVPLCSDANVPVNLGAGTNESRVIVLNRNATTVWETPPIVTLDAQQGIGTLQYHFVGRLYYAIATPLPKLISIVSGTGCIVQSGW